MRGHMLGTRDCALRRQ